MTSFFLCNVRCKIAYVPFVITRLRQVSAYSCEAYIYEWKHYSCRIVSWTTLRRSYSRKQLAIFIIVCVIRSSYICAILHFPKSNKKFLKLIVKILRELKIDKTFEIRRVANRRICYDSVCKQTFFQRYLNNH